MALDDQRFKDHCLLIVGNGGRADYVLAKRRLSAGGRPSHFMTDGADDLRIHYQEIMDDSVYDTFTWQPPPKSMGISSFARKLQGKPRSFWTKNGPDGIKLEPSHKLTISTGASGKKRHVMVTDQEDNVVVAMSGEVVVNPDILTAETFQVEVHQTEINAFGTFSWRFATLALILQFFWQVGKISLSIYFEQRVSTGEMPWFRNLLAALNWCLMGNLICLEMSAYTLTGHRATANMHVVGSLASAVGIMAATPFNLSEFMLCIVGVSCMLFTAPGLHYYNTVDDSPDRCLIPHFKWMLAQLSGTVGCFILFGLIAQTYATLLSSGMALVATFFLPFATAFGETGMIIYTRIMYDRLVHSKKMIDPNGPVAGDQLYMAAPSVVVSAHAFAEGCRLTATLSGAISNGGWSWIPTSIFSILLNLSARLGWSRFAVLQVTKKLFGGPKALELFAPSGWSKFHDELKIYAGYFRFAAILALVAARAIAYGVSGVDGPQAPAFNLSSTCVIICLFCGEVIEDEVVTKELLPVNPAGPGLLKLNAAGDNADPSQLIALEHVATVPDDTWKMCELNHSGRFSKEVSLRRTFTADTTCSPPSPTPTSPTLTSPALTSPEPTNPVPSPPAPSVPKKTVSLSSSEFYIWARLRRFMGQPRSVNSSPALHGLRELPFHIQMSFVGIVAEFTMGLLGLLVGAGYTRGTCPGVLAGSERIFGLAWWEVPLPC